MAEAHAHPARRARYAAATGLARAFNFEIQDADWQSTDVRGVIDDARAQARESGSTTTWHLENHAVPGVATRYGLPRDPERSAIDVARKPPQRHYRLVRDALA